MTRETMTDLWQRADKNKNYVWTIEHVLPQGENIPEAWVQMIANGDREQAKNVQQELVHTIGNLTITGFNSTLGNKSFQEKRERKDQKGHFVGYRNGLSLNEDLLLTDNWGSDQIKQRTEKLVSKIMELYRM